MDLPLIQPLLSALFTLSSGVLLIFALAFVYKRAPYRTGPRGAITWFPKYRRTIVLPKSVFEQRRPYLVLDECLKPFGFIRISGAYLPLEYRKAARAASVAARWTGLRLRFDETPHYAYTRESVVTLEACRPRLLDAGGLWATLASLMSSIEAPSRPCWHTGAVDTRLPHIELVAETTGRLLARVAPSDAGFAVQFLGHGADTTMKTLREQLDFYFGRKQEPDPWRYAIHHCSTAANLYSSITWRHVDPRGDFARTQAGDLNARHTHASPDVS